jgi:DUF1365 family protein
MFTMPRFLGYAFNPLTVYYIHDPHWLATVLEVHNTFHDKHIYVLRPGQTEFASGFHVSPFNARGGMYKVSIKSPPQVDISLSLMADGKTKLDTRVSAGARCRLDDPLRALGICITCGWYIFLTLPRIMYQAWQLHYKKSLLVYPRPEPAVQIGAIVRQQSSTVDRYLSSPDIT